MHFLKHYNNNIVKYDLINKFYYNKETVVPKIKFIILTFDFKKYDFKQLLTSLTALELITNQKATFIKSRKPNISLKIRKGHPIGCKILIRRYKKDTFLSKLLDITMVNKKIVRQEYTKLTLFSYSISNVLIFSELEKNYQFFKLLKTLTVSIGTTPIDYNGFIFLLRSYKING